MRLMVPVLGDLPPSGSGVSADPDLEAVRESLREPDEHQLSRTLPPSRDTGFDAIFRQFCATIGEKSDNMDDLRNEHDK